jgi:plastocyanin
MPLFRPLIGAAVLVAAGLATLGTAPPVLAGDPCFHGYSIPPATTAASTAVDMEPCAFVPTNVSVPTGATVTFTNTSGDVHLLTGANQAWGDKETEIRPGASVSVTFDESGVYAFSCALHRGMSGAVIVGDADAAAAGTADPASGTTMGMDNGTLVTLALTGLAGLAAVGWVVALTQRRRVDARRGRGGQGVPVG